MKIKFRRKSQAEWLVLFVWVMPFAFFLLMNILRLPSLVKYTVDIGWIALLISMIRSRINLPNIQAKTLGIIAGVFFFMTLIGFLLNYQSLLYYFWGLRNNARFFVFFFACICFLSGQSIEAYLRFFDGLFWLNLPAVLYQYFVLGKTQDYLGGIFGIEKGCNGYMNIFLVIIVTKSILYYMYQKENLTQCLVKVAVALMIAVLSELRIFFLEFVIIVILATVITKFSYRKLWVLIGAMVGVLVAVQMFTALFPEFSGWFSLESIWKTASSKSGYTGRNDLNRMTAVSIVLNRFLPSGLDKLFGLGLGNCDYASFDFLITPFYRAYKNLNYSWFSTAFLVLETGVAGLSLYIAFFVAIYFFANKRKKIAQGNLIYCQLAQIMAVLSVSIIIYNSSMRTEAAYMMYFILSLPFIRNEKAQESQQNILEKDTPKEV